LDKGYYWARREQRQETDRERRCEALQPQIVRSTTSREREQQAEKKLAGARTSPAGRQEHLPVRAPLRGTSATVRTREHRDVVVTRQAGGDLLNDESAATTIDRVGRVVVA
jgi:hypothetical protein